MPHDEHCDHEHNHDHSCCGGHDHEHNHDHSCCGGHDHEHNHDHSCCGGHDHEHNHGHSCGCGHDHETKHRRAGTAPIELTENQKNFLHQLGHMPYLPVARFTIKDSREEAFASTALAPVFLRSAADDMKAVKALGAFLQTLEDLGFITLDYDIPLSGYDYEEYKTSALYEYFCKTVTEGASRPDFLGNTPVLELGSMALTEEGEKIAAVRCDHDHHDHDQGQGD